MSNIIILYAIIVLVLIHRYIIVKFIIIYSLFCLLLYLKENFQRNKLIYNVLECDILQSRTIIRYKFSKRFVCRILFFFVYYQEE